MDHLLELKIKLYTSTWVAMEEFTLAIVLFAVFCIIAAKADSQGLEYVEDGTIRYAERLQEIDPNLKSFFYRNTVINYGG